VVLEDDIILSQGWLLALSDGILAEADAAVSSDVSRNSNAPAATASRGVLGDLGEAHGENLAPPAINPSFFLSAQSRMGQGSHSMFSPWDTELASSSSERHAGVTTRPAGSVQDFDSNDPFPNFQRGISWIRLFAPDTFEGENAIDYPTIVGSGIATAFVLAAIAYFFVLMASAYVQPPNKLPITMPSGIARSLSGSLRQSNGKQPDPNGKQKQLAKSSNSFLDRVKQMQETAASIPMKWIIGCAIIGATSGVCMSLGLLEAGKVPALPTSPGVHLSNRACCTQARVFPGRYAQALSWELRHWWAAEHLDPDEALAAASRGHSPDRLEFVALPNIVQHIGFPSSA